MSCRYASLLQSFKSQGQPIWTADSECSVLEPYTYLLTNPGKDIRTSLIHAFNAWLQVPQESLDVVLRAVEMLHTASLLIDDVEDDSVLRRGKEAAHLQFGAASTINAANYIYFSAMALIRSTGNVAVTDIFEEEMLNLHRGQGLELYWRDRGVGNTGYGCPSEEEYVHMVNDKTGGLLRMAIRLLQALSMKSTNRDITTTATTNDSRNGDSHNGHDNHDDDYVPLANVVGILFQIRDDYMNLASLRYCREKGFCEDLTEGKFSFPVIHAIKQGNHELSARLRKILSLKTSDVALKIEACEILETLGSLKYTIGVVAEMDQLCRQEISNLGHNRYLSSILDILKIEGDGSEISSTIAFAREALANGK